MNILVLHGPNLNLIGKYSTQNITLDKINRALRKQAHDLGHELIIFHFLEEGKFVRQIQRRRKNIDGIIFNPGALSQNCFVIKELVQILGKPLIEVHIESIPKSKYNFNKSVLTSVAKARIFGETIQSYQKALAKLDNIFNSPI